ncbi:MAG: hypothetical protein ACYTFG_17640, partial [Planctomycetota bacterium]
MGEISKQGPFTGIALVLALGAFLITGCGPTGAVAMAKKKLGSEDVEVRKEGVADLMAGSTTGDEKIEV